VGKAHKKRQATHITPLRPSTLAAFPPWGNSTGAGCVGLAGCKYTRFIYFCKHFL